MSPRKPKWTTLYMIMVHHANASLSHCQVTLQNEQLWREFHKLDTEMIITKSGRRMFPPLEVKFHQIDPKLDYCVFLDFVPSSRCRFKYSPTGGWAPAGSEEAQSPHRLYMHPESPAKGEYWMSQSISFNRVKLTNTQAPPIGQIVLSSMHKYQPRVIIAQTSDPRVMNWSPNSQAVFPETQFIAVTAYQNEKITQLKIDNNPFAKGFRHNGQAKCKRKRHSAEATDDEEFICVVDSDDTDVTRSSTSANSAGVSGTPSPISEEESLPSSIPAEQNRLPKQAEIEKPTDLSAQRREYATEKCIACEENSQFHPYANRYFGQYLMNPNIYRNYYPLPYLPMPYYVRPYEFPPQPERNVNRFNIALEPNREEPRITFTNFSIDSILRS